MKVARLIAQRLPSAQSIWGVYAVIVTLVYSWSLFTSFYKLPSWLFYMTGGQILSLYAYSFSLNLLESLLLLTVVLVLNQTLFLGLRDQGEFQARSILAVAVVLISAMTRLVMFQTYEDISGFLNGEVLWWVVTCSLGLLIAVVAPRNAQVRTFLGGVAERAMVFLYIYLPLSFISLIVVAARNLF